MAEDKIEGILTTNTKPVYLPRTSSRGNLQGPPGNPTAVGAAQQPDNRPLTGYDRKKAVREAQTIMGIPPQSRNKK